MSETQVLEPLQEMNKKGFGFCFLNVKVYLQIFTACGFCYLLKELL